MIERDQVLAQLAAIRAICDALAANLLADLAATPAGCPHPEDLRQDATTLRGPKRFYCRACKQLVVDQPTEQKGEQ